MRPLILSVVLIFGIVLYVQARSLENMDSDLELSEKDFIESPTYLNLLTFLQNRKRNIDKNDDDGDDNDSSQNIDGIMKRSNERIPSAYRRFFLFNTKRPSHRFRPSYSYGRKSHWDVFFG